MQDFTFTIDDLGFHGQGLSRPECVCCLESGVVVVSNGGGGVSRIAPDGSTRHIVAPEGSHKPMTNGFAIDRNGDYLLANLALDGGGVWKITDAGVCEPFITEVEGEKMPPTNFVGVDAKNRVWATVSTRHNPRFLAYRKDIADGYIVMSDTRGTRIVAEGLGYTNEAIVDPSGDWLVVNETMARRTSKFRIGADGSLGPRETVTEYGAGVYPDGLAFDEEGAFWMTSVLSNRLIRVTPDGSQTVIFEDSDPDMLAVCEAAYQSDSLSSEHMNKVVSKLAKSISSIAFGGPDRRTGYMGNLLDNRIYTFRSPVAGAKPSHWGVRV
jgi:sugar lactone lactonase YvrE